MPNISSFKNREEFNEWYRNYRSKKTWKEYHKKYNQLWREKNSTKKDNVRRLVSRAVKKGILQKTPCEVCKEKKVEAHHYNYSKPLDVMWLCRKHHRQVDVATGKRRF